MNVIIVRTIILALPNLTIVTNVIILNAIVVRALMLNSIIATCLYLLSSRQRLTLEVSTPLLNIYKSNGKSNI